MSSSRQTSVDDPEEDESATVLKNGTKMPVIMAALRGASGILMEGMPVVRGEVEEKNTTALRDPERNTVALKRTSVPSERVTCVTTPVYLLIGV